MVPRVDESLGMRHQAEDPAGRVAEAGDGTRRAVGVRRIRVGRVAVRVGVLEDDLAGTIERVEVGRRGRDESALTVCHGELDRRGELRRDERRVSRSGLQLDPSGFESAQLIPRQGDRAGRGPSGEESAPDQDLESVADAQDQAAPVVEAPQGVAEESPEPGRQDSPVPRSSP